MTAQSWISSGINNVYTSLGYWDSNFKLYARNPSVILNEFNRTLKQHSSDCCCWLAGATCITEIRLAFLRTHSLWSPVTDSTDIVYIYNWWLLLTDSFSATRNSLSSHCLKYTSPYHAILMTPSICARKCIFPWHCSNKCTFIINHRKNCRRFLLILNEVQKGLKNFLGQPL